MLTVYLLNEYTKKEFPGTGSMLLYPHPCSSLGPACTQRGETGCLANLPHRPPPRPPSLLKSELPVLPTGESWKSLSQETLTLRFAWQLIPMWFGQANHSLWDISKVKTPVAVLPINQCVFYSLCVSTATHHVSPTPRSKGILLLLTNIFCSEVPWFLCCFFTCQVCSRENYCQEFPLGLLR